MKQQIFISSVHKELATERRAIRDFIRNDALFSQYFDPKVGTMGTSGAQALNRDKMGTIETLAKPKPKPTRKGG